MTDHLIAPSIRGAAITRVLEIAQDFGYTVSNITSDCSGQMLGVHPARDGAELTPAMAKVLLSALGSPDAANAHQRNFMGDRPFTVVEGGITVGTVPILVKVFTALDPAAIDAAAATA